MSRLAARSASTINIMLMRRTLRFSLALVFFSVAFAPLAAQPRSESPSGQPAESQNPPSPESDVAADSDGAANAADSAQNEDTTKFPQGEPGEQSRLRSLTPQLAALRDRLRIVLGMYYDRQLCSRDHNPWEMMHAIIAYGHETQIHRGGPTGQRINALAYLGNNGPCHGLTLLYLDGDRVNARKGPYVQGHYAQLLAILAQCRVSLDYPLQVSGRKFTLRDLLETEKYTCDEGMELTFKLISFAHYCDSDVTWKNFKGDTWSLPRIIRAELAAPILSNAACGGTHRLTGFAYAVRNRKRQGKPIDGEWLRAQKYLDDYHKYTLALQNSDGSFSTEWFRRREARPDLDRRIQTTGHILEWLVYSLPAEELDHPQVVKAVRYLTNLLYNERARQWEIGPLGHAIHALVLYDVRRFKPFDGAGSIAGTAKELSVDEQPEDDFDVRQYIAPARESRERTSDSAVEHEARRRWFGSDEQPSGEESVENPERLTLPFFKQRASTQPDDAMPDERMRQLRALQQRVMQRALQQRALQQRMQSQQNPLRAGDARQWLQQNGRLWQGTPSSQQPHPAPEAVPAPIRSHVEAVAPGVEEPAAGSSNVVLPDTPESTATEDDGPALIGPG
jgi:hypothetical protein